MKICSLKTIATWFAMATMTTSTAAFAHHHGSHSHHFHHHHHSHHHSCIISDTTLNDFNDRLLDDLFQIVNDLNNLFAIQGTFGQSSSTLANPLTNPFLAGYLAAINGTGPGSIGEAGLDINNILAQFGFSVNVTPVIIAAEAYSTAVNTNQPQIVQQAAFAAWEAAIAALAAELQQAGVTGTTTNPLNNSPDTIAGLLSNLVTLESELIQAYRGVLDATNNFGANPAIPASEANAIPIITDQVADLVVSIVDLVLNNLACPSTRS
jgi:hypothetical protein